jgi:hypothetical protein
MSAYCWFAKYPALFFQWFVALRDSFLNTSHWLLMTTLYGQLVTNVANVESVLDWSCFSAITCLSDFCLLVMSCAEVELSWLARLQRKKEHVTKSSDGPVVRRRPPGRVVDSGWRNQLDRPIAWNHWKRRLVVGCRKLGRAFFDWVFFVSSSGTGRVPILDRCEVDTRRSLGEILLCYCCALVAGFATIIWFHVCNFTAHRLFSFAILILEPWSSAVISRCSVKWTCFDREIMIDRGVSSNVSLLSCGYVFHWHLWLAASWRHELHILVFIGEILFIAIEETRLRYVPSSSTCFHLFVRSPVRTYIYTWKFSPLAGFKVL